MLNEAVSYSQEMVSGQQDVQLTSVDGPRPAPPGCGQPGGGREPLLQRAWECLLGRRSGQACLLTAPQSPRGTFRKGGEASAYRE